jgi:hypothetical protein
VTYRLSVEIHQEVNVLRFPTQVERGKAEDVVAPIKEALAFGRG